MAEAKLPFMNAYGNITKVLNKIKDAATPDRFTHDYLGTKLGMKGGSPRPVIPFLKRMGFLGTDGSPTELYKRFRNPTESGRAAAQALRKGYQSLFEMNEYAQDLKDKELKGLIVQATGGEPGSSTTGGILGSFKALKAFASFESGGEVATEADTGEEASDDTSAANTTGEQSPARLNLSYTINLNLPATSDIAVFNSIFKALREHILRE